MESVCCAQMEKIENNLFVNIIPIERNRVASGDRDDKKNIWWTREILTSTS